MGKSTETKASLCRRNVPPESIFPRNALPIGFEPMTTGATTEACTAALLAGGAHRVMPFTLAKALMDEDLGEDFVRT